MNHRARTKDENFMLRLYEEASKQPEMETPLDCYHIGTLAGLHPRAVDAICKLLIRANFIKKRGDEISITEQGIRLVTLLHNSPQSQ